MSESENIDNLTLKSMATRFLIMVCVSLGAGMAGHYSGALEFNQAVACGVFLAIIMGTLFFWNFRLAIAFLGLSVLIFTNSLNIARFVTSSSLEVILFLVGMMIIVGALRDLGFFTWVVQLIVSMPNISGKKFIACTAFASALLACAVDEVTSIIFVSTLIFQVCDRLKLNPLPYVMICVLATNVGSAGTMMGNPVGIFIGTKAGLTFGDFMIWAFPLMILALLATIAVTMLYFRKDLKLFDSHLRDRLSKNLSLAPVVEVPYKRGLFLLLATICVIASHHPLEQLFHLEKNSILLIAPLICSGIVMILKHNRARYYVEREVDWWTLVFFMLLFAVAGTVQFTGVDKVMSTGFTRVCGTGEGTLVPFILSVSAVGSAFVDNVIFVAAFCPVIEQLAQTMKDMPLWFALLFGACLGGNITMIGSTANIVALGMLERKSHVHVNFLHWLKIGFLSALTATLIAWAGIMALSPLMPDRYARLSASAMDAGSDLEFNNKKVTVIGRAVDGKLRLESEHQAYAVNIKPGTVEIPSGVRAYRGVMTGDPDCGYTLEVEDVVAKADANAH
ncbi:MAG: SLC13 family permease [Victivallaceae bacterium]|nr:SLC13 family permease [Victivallaceae bacterium]